MDYLLNMKVRALGGVSEGSCEVILELEDGRKFAFGHRQECCEQVFLLSYQGMDNLIGSPIRIVEKTSKPDNMGLDILTTYTFLTDKGLAEMVWEGTEGDCGIGSPTVEVTVHMPMKFKGNGVPQ